MGLTTNRINGVLAIGFCAVMVAGCSGGGASIGTSATRPQSQNPVLTAQSTNGALSTKAANGHVTFTIGIKPKQKTSRITPQYVSPSTQSLLILTDSANPVVVNLTPFSPNCSPNPTVPGAYICTASLNVPAGNHVFSVTAYEGPGALGSALSTNSTGAVDVKPTGVTAVPIVLEGVVHYVALMLATTNPAVGTPVTIGLTAILEDADQNLIVGPASYAYPVTLTTTDSINGTLSKTVLKSPADVSGITVDYSGAKVASITYSAIATDLPNANGIDAVLTPGAGSKHRLYVTNEYVPQPSGFVSVYDLNDLTARPTTFTGRFLYNPSYVAVDASGKLFVQNYVHRVSIFDTAAPGNPELPGITGGTGSQFAGVAVDASGKLYVANGLGNSVSVFDTAHGNAALPMITGGGLDEPNGVAVDTSGKVYVTNVHGHSVSVFDTAHGNVALPVITGGGLGLGEPYGLAVDASGKLYVATNDNVLVFDTAHSNAILPAITGGGIDRPYGVAVDASGKLYVTNPFLSTVSVFDTVHGNAVLPPITGGGLDSPMGVTVQ